MINLTQENIQQIMSSSKPVVIDFYADWCGPCKKLEPLFQSLSEKYNNEIIFAKVDTDEQSELTNMFRISSLPTLILIKNGQVVNQLVGFNPSKVESFIIS